MCLKFSTAFHILSTSHIKSKHESDQKRQGILHREDKFELLKMKQNIISLMHVIVLHKMVQNLCYIPVEGVGEEFEYVWAGYVPLAF